MPKDYYSILGIPSTATPEEIRSAYRRRAMELHPDHSRADSGPFLEVQEAYGTLGNEAQRRSYDRDEEESHASGGLRGPAGAAPIRRRPRQRAEPLRDAWLADSFRTAHPSLEEIFDRLWQNFDSRSRPKAERFQNLDLEFVLTRDEARLGGRIRLFVPARASCPECAGRGCVGVFECWRCMGRGSIIGEWPLTLDVPPGIPDGYRRAISPDRFGIRDMHLTLTFRIGGEADTG